MIDWVGVSADIYRSVYTPLVLGFWFLLSFADAARWFFYPAIRALLDAHDMQSYVLGQRAVHAPCAYNGRAGTRELGDSNDE
jgi:hypothetical protein